MVTNERVLLLVVLVSVLLAGCGTEPVPASSIPVYPGADAIAHGENEMVDQLAEIIQESAGDEGVGVEINLYRLPEGAAWTDVKAFYQNEIAGEEWVLEQNLSNESDVFSTIGWSRGSGASEQALIVGYIADVLGGQGFLITGLFSE
ncbi:MAG: hypothetical protein PVJ23_10320 [Anaerolineae bacterium]|jgi:hypothetical protein